MLWYGLNPQRRTKGTPAQALEDEQQVLMDGAVTLFPPPPAPWVSLYLQSFHFVLAPGLVASGPHTYSLRSGLPHALCLAGGGHRHPFLG